MTEQGFCRAREGGEAVKANAKKEKSKIQKTLRRWKYKPVPPHLKKDLKLVSEWWRVIIYVISANIGTLIATWLITVQIIATGLADWIWAAFIAFTLITQITTWGIALFTYYIAMLTRMTAIKAGATMTDFINEFENMRDRFRRIGVTFDYFEPLLKEAESEWKSLTEAERKEIIEDARSQIRKKVRELKSKGSDIPPPPGRVMEK